MWIGNEEVLNCWLNVFFLNQYLKFKIFFQYELVGIVVGSMSL